MNEPEARANAARETLKRIDARRLGLVQGESRVRGRKQKVEANLLNRDKGFVREVQEVRIKVETFDFTKYRVIDDSVSLGQNGGPQAGQGQTATVAAAGGRARWCFWRPSPCRGRRSGWMARRRG